MDWSRAKTILILAFLFLDVFLGYQVYASRTERWLNTEAVQGDQWNIERYLNQQNIQLKTEIPQETAEMKYLNVEYLGVNPLTFQDMPGIKITLDKSAIMAKLTPPLPIRDQTSAEEILRQLSPRLAHADQYQLDRYYSGKERLVYWQLYDKVPLFVARLDVMVGKGTVDSYTQSYFHIRSQGSGRQVTSAYTALRSLVEKEVIQPGEKIESVTLGYYGYSYNAVIQVLAPVWRVIHDGKEHYINAFTGAVEMPLERSRSMTQE